MTMLYEHSLRDTFVHRLDPRTKLLFTVCVVFLSLLLPRYEYLLILGVAVVVWGLAARLSPWTYRKILFLLIPFCIVITTVQVIVQAGTGGTLLAEAAGFPIYIEGFERGLRISLRALVLGVSFAIFMMLTHPADIAQAAHKMGAPFRYAYMVGFALRFLPLFVDEFVTIRQAQASRGLDENRYGPLTRLISLPPLLFPLAMDALRRSNDIALALEMRGLSTASVYGRTYLKDMEMTPADILISLLAVAVLGTVLVARISGALN